ncbi:MAG: iron-sulfur cluster assembly scaffold protein [Oligoflexia bacterium]|nr:iron-sulfur cluster assembly scaffold protein [Oligoflexia bacterium]MBF0367673.1 iron-sulfur cluster assembly scaffold protein [Oligoflexia bacterium]
MTQVNQDEFFGRMSDPTSASRIQGPCGDDMEFYLSLENHIIADVMYFTETGCEHTRIAGRAVSRKIKGRNLIEALAVSPAEILYEEKQLLRSGSHCAILAVTTMYRAIVDYLLKYHQ